MKKATDAHTACPVTAVAGLLSDAWTMLIVHNLLGTKVMRFCELERALVGISTRTLTLKLKTLEERKIILKNDNGYAISKTGLKLKPIIAAMEKFGKSF